MVQFIEDYSLQNISNRINRRRSQTSIPYIKILVCFFAGEQYMETPVEVSMKVQRVSGVLSRESIWNVNYLQVCFCRIGSSLIFFRGRRGEAGRGGGAWNIPNRKYHVFLYFLRNVHLSHFPPREKIPCFREKKDYLFRQYKKDHVPA